MINKQMQLPNLIKSPAFLQKLQWVINPVPYMENAALQYPNIFSAKIFSGNSVVFVNHPQAIQEILTNDRKKFTAPGEYNAILQPLIGDYSVIMLNGENHRKRRQLVMPSFHGERIKAYGDLIVNLTKKVMDATPLNQPFLARSVMQEISMQVILQSVFGLYEGTRCEQVKDLTAKMLDIFKSPFSSGFLFFPFLQKDLGAASPWGRFLRQRSSIDQLIYAEIAEHRENPDPSRIDILSLLMSARDEQGQGLTDKELRDELMTLLLAGHETTATAMAWGLYWSHYIPETREKILNEINTLGDKNDSVNILKLPYLTAFCNETLRIYPVAMLTFVRVAQEQVEILGHQIEPNTTLLGCIYLVHHREDLYPQSKQFNLNSKESHTIPLTVGVGRNCSATTN